MHSKATNFRTPNAIHLHKPFFSVLKHQTFLQTKNFPFEQAFSCYSQKPAFFCAKSLSIWTNLSLLSSKATLFHHKRHPFAPSHNLLSAKNMTILFISALTPYAVTSEPRTDSKPFRRRFVRKTGFGSCRRKALLKASPTELWIVPGSPEGRNPLGYFWFFSYKRKE